MAYPSSHVPAGGGVYNPVSGVTATYGRNALGQLFNLSIAGQTVVSSAYYNAAGQQQQMTWDGWTEDHWFNNAGQMWKQEIKNSSNTVIGGWEYYFPATGNNGRITGTKDLQSLEEITYQYDALNRLTSVTKTGGGWAETYGYGGFGNLNQKGASSWLIDTSTNRLHSSTGATYDSNGNLTGLGGGVSYIYDAANRITMAHPSQERYAYTADNRRVWKYKPGWGEEITFWGGGGRLSTYRLDTVGGTYQLYFVEQTRNVWFGSKLIRTGPGATPTKLATDRLGSVRMRQTGNNPIEYLTYAPYGEQRSGPGGEGEKFATYYRDQTGLDYADQRYYSSGWGRFGTSDPDSGSAKPQSPTSWNRYSYVEFDPANLSDPTGLRIAAETRDFIETCMNIPHPLMTGGALQIPDRCIPDVKQRQARQMSMARAEQLEMELGVSERCAKGMVAAQKRTDSIDRANASSDTLKEAADKYGIDWRMLAALGSTRCPGDWV